MRLIWALAVLVLVGACTTDGTGAAVQTPPVGQATWAAQCLNTDGPIVHAYDGLTMTAAAKRADQLAQTLRLVGRDGHCVPAILSLPRGLVLVVVSRGLIVAARSGAV